MDLARIVSISYNYQPPSKASAGIIAPGLSLKALSAIGTLISSFVAPGSGSPTSCDIPKFCHPLVSPPDALRAGGRGVTGSTCCLPLRPTVGDNPTPASSSQGQAAGRTVHSLGGSATV